MTESPPWNRHTLWHMIIIPKESTDLRCANVWSVIVRTQSMSLRCWDTCSKAWGDSLNKAGKSERWEVKEQWGWTLWNDLRHLYCYSSLAASKFSLTIVSMTSWKTSCMLLVSVAVVKCGYMKQPVEWMCRRNRSWMKNAAISTSWVGPGQSTKINFSNWVANS